MLHASPGWREKKRVKKKRSGKADGRMVLEGWKFHTEESLCPRTFPLMGNAEMKIWTALLVIDLHCHRKLKCETAVMGMCYFHHTLCSLVFKKKKRKKEITPLFGGVRNGNTSRIERKHILFDKSICVWWNTFNISVVYACSDTLQQGLTDWLGCQQHFITLKHNIAISRHFRIHLLQLSDTLKSRHLVARVNSALRCLFPEQF